MSAKLTGLQKLCRMYGRMRCGEIMMAWDYMNECALPEKELHADKARWMASERARFELMKAATQQQEER